MKSYNIGDAKTRLSAILWEIERTGEPVSLTRNGTPVARITPEPKARVVFGLGRDLIERLPDFSEPMSAEEIADWDLS